MTNGFKLMGMYSLIFQMIIIVFSLLTILYSQDNDKNIMMIIIVFSLLTILYSQDNDKNIMMIM